MAEAIAAVGIVASIVQLADFGGKVLHRLNEFQSNVGDIPKTFQYVKAELPILLETLKQTQLSVENGNGGEETKKAVLFIVNACLAQISLLDDLVDRALPKETDSWTRKTRKAVRSIRQDAEVAKITANLRGHIQSLTNYRVAALPTLAPAHSMSTERISSNLAIQLTVIDQPSSLPRPSSNVPFRRDRDFVHREILSEVKEKCSKPASRVALVGLGGVG
jgi:N-terminal domain on NACHT_NTPase and P-loop NTPases